MASLMRRLAFAVTVALVGCSHNSGIIPVGNGTYMISKSEWGIEHTGSSVKADALNEASRYCAGMHKELEIVNTTQNDMVPFKSEAQAEIEFRCRKPDNGSN